MTSTLVKCVQISILVFSAAVLATAQEKPEKEQTKKDEANATAGKLYRNQEPLFRPPPLPVQRRLQVTSGAEHPPSFFQSVPTSSSDQAEARQFLVEPFAFQQPFQQNFAEGQGLPSGGFSNNQNQFQSRQQNSFNANPNQFQQFNNPPQRQQQPPQNQPQNFQFGQNQNQQQSAPPPPQQQQQQQQSFQDQNNFQSRQQETLPTLPPVFIPPSQPIGNPPALQSPIRNLFRQPEPSGFFGLLQRFFNLFNFN